MIIFAADLKNQSGEPAHICQALSQRGVNVELAAFSFTASDEYAARAALIEASVSFAEHPSRPSTVPVGRGVLEFAS